MLEHPTNVVILVRRIVACLAVLSLTLGSPALCDGWAATPEARMACCTDGACPMHKPDAADVTHHPVTQSEADSCCAMSEHDDSAPSQSSAPVTPPLAVVSTPVTPVVLDHVATTDAWRTLVPISIAHVPRHLLLSVFLV